VADTRALNENRSRLIDAIDNEIYAIKTMKKHPQFPRLYARLIEANARAFVEPSFQSDLAAQILTSTSEEEQPIISKLAESQEQRCRIAAWAEEIGKQSSRLNERSRVVASSLIVEGPNFSIAELTRLEALMQERVAEADNAKQLQEMMKRRAANLAGISD
jgi:hypothetical protein